VSQLSRELQLAIQAAAREAMARRHAYLTVEHLLYALAFDRANVSQLKNRLEAYFQKDLEKEPGEEPVELRQTLAFHRVLEGALQHAASAEKEIVEAGDLLAAIFQEPDSHAVALLREQGVSRLDVLRFISHGISKGPDPEDGEPAPLGGDAESDEEGEGAARSSAPSTSSPGGARTTRCSWASPGWARPRWPRGWPGASTRVGSPRR
jgi:ATP-dependent Clp protease ATP-binding subunit ClpA